MKKTLMMLILIAFTTSIMAMEPIRWGIMGGMNVSNYSDGDYISDSDARIGFSAGVNARQYFGPNNGLFAELGVLLSLKGSKATEHFDGLKISQRINPYYLDIPITIGYDYPIGDNVKAFVGFVPMFSIGLFGKTKYELDYRNEKITRKYDIFKDGDKDLHRALRRFDFGLGLTVGCELYDLIRISLGYEWGLIDVISNTGIRNRNFQLGVTYLF